MHFLKGHYDMLCIKLGVFKKAYICIKAGIIYLEKYIITYFSFLLLLVIF